MPAPIYSSLQAQKAIQYIKETYGDEPEFLWCNFTSAIWRNPQNHKWYGILQQVNPNKFGLPDGQLVETLSLTSDPLTVASLIDGQKIFEAYHMNKRNWFTIILDDSSDMDVIYELINGSYKRVSQKH